ncbi:hypothetical protein [Methanococcoides sp. NM1]|uniref:hypothetical protein n=1 Tax=Methanococcoides sp. NM1 TaxID=1201013 RepID=UPI0014383191|nr:hypothetical protein [Methanococcoides sp. NM1]
MKYVEKTCPVCKNKFVVDKKVADREMYCTLRCCSKAMGDNPVINAKPVEITN